MSSSHGSTEMRREKDIIRLVMDGKPVSRYEVNVLATAAKAGVPGAVKALWLLAKDSCRD